MSEVTVDEGKALALLSRAVRRSGGQDVPDGEAAFPGEDLEISPGWSLDELLNGGRARQHGEPWRYGHSHLLSECAALGMRLATEAEGR